MKKTYIIFGSIIITSVILGPILINELYKFSDGYKTAWGPIELLVYYGAVLSFIGTTFLGMITVSLNKKSNDISDRLLSIQESNSNNRIMPVLKMHSAQKGKFTGGYLLDDKTLYYYVDETPLVLGGNMHSMFTRFLKFELKSITDILSLDIQLKSLIFNGKTLFLKHSIGNADYINILKSDMGIDIYLLFDEKLYEKMICSNERKLTFQIIMKNIYNFSYRETIMFNFKSHYMYPQYEEMIGHEQFDSSFKIDQIVTPKNTIIDIKE